MDGRWFNFKEEILALPAVWADLEDVVVVLGELKLCYWVVPLTPGTWSRQICRDRKWGAN